MKCIARAKKHCSAHIQRFAAALSARKVPLSSVAMLRHPDAELAARAKPSQKGPLRGAAPYLMIVKLERARASQKTSAGMLLARPR